MEFMLNFCEIFVYIPYVIKYFVKEPGLNIREIQSYSFLFYLPICYSLVPVLSMMMDFLWLAYRKYEYKYTIIRWTWYIVIRISVNLFVDYSSIDISIPLLKNLPINYKTIFYDLVSIFYGIVSIIDFIQFVYYARKFYLHLKSREKEIRLFYFDKKAYLDSKYLRVHFKIATILVGIAFFFFALSNTDNLFFGFYHISNFIPIPQQLQHILLIVFEFYTDFMGNFVYFIFKVLFILDYLYIFIVVVYKSYRDGQKLKNINNYIKPIMKQYMIIIITSILIMLN